MHDDNIYFELKHEKRASLVKDTRKDPSDSLAKNISSDITLFCIEFFYIRYDY